MDILFDFCRSIGEVLARSLPHHPDSRAARLHLITSQKQSRELPRVAKATRTSVGPQFWIMVRRFLRSSFKA